MTEIKGPGAEVFRDEVAPWDPMGAEALYKQWRKALADGADVKPKTLEAAIDRVYWDGMYGPVSDQDWAEQDGRKITLARAQRILRDAYENFDPPDFRVPTYQLAHGDPSPTTEEIRERFGDEPPTDAEMQRWLDEVEEQQRPWASGSNYPNDESFQERFLHSAFGFYREIYGRYP